MVQWRNPEGVCKRCGGGLDDRPQPQAEPQSSAPRRKPVPVGLIVLIVVVGIGSLAASLTVPKLLKVRGTPVEVFSDNMQLVRLEFPDGWKYLRLDKRDLLMPHEDHESTWQDLRGSFYCGDDESPDAVLYLRIVSHGLSIGGPHGVNWEDIAATLHVGFEQQLARLGGTYTGRGLQSENVDLEGPARHADGSINPDAPPVRSQILVVRLDGAVETAKPFLAWHRGGSFSVISYGFNFQTREYWYHAVVREDREAAVLPQVEAIIASAGIRQTRL